MKKIIIISTLLLLTTGNSFSQKLEHLRPIPVTEISLVTHDTSSYKSPVAKQLCSYIDTSITFYDCRNDKGTIGYVLDYHKPRLFKSYLSSWGEDEENAITSEGYSIFVGLKEVQRAEFLLAKELDLKADSSQTIQRALTAPRFYQYVRQYSFYRTMDGDTCVKINFAIPDIYNCLDSYYQDPCDGGDSFWRATLNLSKKRILNYDVNGPEIITVDGRSKEPKGLSRKCIFRNGTLYREKVITYDQLPKKVRTKVERTDDTTNVYIEVNCKGTLYYIVFSDSTQKGYRQDGTWLFTGAENLFSGDLPAEKLLKVPHINKMLSFIRDDMSRRGRDFKKYGKLISLEVVDKHYVIHIWYYPNIDYYKMWAAYTFDQKGDFVGIDIDGWH
ncbi:MAG: hypothetical protein IKN78_01680 [Bacteroidales bacterium]|nr:hypothetical protein [Bacteroidales bacterium]